MKQLEKELEKAKMYYGIMNVWFSQEQRGKSLVPYMKKKGYQKVAIYGMAELGERLYYELTKGGLDVAYVIDQSSYVLGEFELIKPTDVIPKVDVIIVTAEYYFDEVKETLKIDKSTPIIGISTLIGNAFRMNW